MTDNVEKLYTEVKEGIKGIQAKHSEFISTYKGDSETAKAEIKSLQDKVCETLEKANQAEAKAKKLEESFNSLEADLKRTNLGDSERTDIVGEYKTAMREYARKNKQIDTDLIVKYNTHLVNKFATHESADNKQSFIKSLNAQSNPDGGYLVLPERIQNFKVERNFETSPIRSIANIITTANESVEIVIDDDESASGGWVSETGSRDDTSNAQVAILKIEVHEQYAQPKISQKLLDDASIDIEAWLSNKTQDILIRTENSAFVTGNGAGKPKGFLTYAAWASAGVYERNKLEQINSGTSATIVANTLKKNLVNSLKEIYQPNATFLMKRAAFGEITTLQDGSGAYLLNPNSLKEGDTKILLGKPVLFVDDMEAIGANALSIAYGDFKMGYTIVDRLGIRVLRDPYTNKPLIKFYTTKRVGGAVTNFEAIKIYKLAA